jgi:thiamine pyrophosphokinase
MILSSDFSQYHSVLCLNGTLPKESFFSNLKDLPIIAADGAANKLREINITPDLIIGDLDSINLNDFSDSRIIHRPDQDKSDFQKSLDYLSEIGLLPSLILGANGGFIDHILHNINIIITYGCSFYSPPLLGVSLQGAHKYHYKLAPGTKISLIGFNHARVKTSGLKWELDGEVIHFPGNNSCFNRVKEENISIDILAGDLLLLVYQDPINDHGLL